MERKRADEESDEGAELPIINQSIDAELGRLPAALRGQGAFGPSLKAIPPTVPSFRPAPPPFDEKAIPLLKIKKGNMPSKTAQPASPTKHAATGPKLPAKIFRLGRIKAAVWENEADQKKFFNVTFARTYMDEARNF